MLEGEVGASTARRLAGSGYGHRRCSAAWRRAGNAGRSGRRRRSPFALLCGSLA